MMDVYSDAKNNNNRTVTTLAKILHFQLDVNVNIVVKSTVVKSIEWFLNEIRD